MVGWNDMDFTFDRFLGLLFLYSISYFVGTFFLRDLLWSIVWCDKKGKNNRLKKLRNNRTFVERMKMNYLSEYVDKRKKAFDFWITIKKIYDTLQFLFLLVYFVFSFLLLKGYDFKFFRYSISFIMLQTAVFLFIFMCQTDINKNTKYDRIRIYEKNRRRGR